MNSARSNKVKALVAKFKSVTTERLERLNNAFVVLETTPSDTEAAASLVREIHTLKGEAKLMGFEQVNVVAHRTEDLIFRARDAGFRFTEELSGGVLAGLDLIGALMSEQGASADDVQAFVERVTGILEGDGEEARSSDPGTGEIRRSSVPPPSREPAAAAPRSARQPTPKSADDEKSSSKQPVAGLTKKAATEKEREAGESPVSAEPAGPSGGEARGRPAPPSEVEGEHQKARRTIRVDAEKLDFLADRVADLSRSHLQIEEAFGALRVLTKEWRSVHRGLLRGEDSPGKREEALSKLEALNMQLSAVLSRDQEDGFVRENTVRELESAVKDLRLIPLSSLFERYPRAVRDLGRELGKRVRFSIEGGSLEVDNRVLENLDEPLLHLIRNAVDHGIEPQSERRRAGKSLEGSIRLSAMHAGSHVEIAVSDDGCGLDPEVIRAKAIETKLVTPERAARMTTDEILRLVLVSGFSTRERTTDISGRGVGLDVARERVEALGGSLGLEGRPGVGTRMVLRVPISVALMPALVIRLGRLALAVPSHSVSAILEVPESDRRSVGSHMAFRYGDEHMPLESLPNLLGLPADEDMDEDMARRVLVVEDQGRQLGLWGAKLVAEQHLTLKPLDPFLGGMHMFIGTTLLEDGEPALVFSVSELMRRVQQSVAAPMIRQQTQQVKDSPHVVLLVEDSEVVRDMLEGIIRELGHQVLEATNGRDALARAEETMPDLVVTDLEMPVMDGFELIERLRGSSATAHLPIIVLSSRGSREDKQRAGELGADAYLVKSEFAEERLAETIDRFLESRRGGGA